MTVIRMSVATVTASLASKISLCAVMVYNHRLGRRKWRYNRSVKPAPEIRSKQHVSAQRHSRQAAPPQSRPAGVRRIVLGDSEQRQVQGVKYGGGIQGESCADHR